jgi:hypothetical protein
MLKYCGDELDPSRTLLDDHPVEVARQMALAGRADFVLVRPSELISRAWLKDAADAHARLCPNIKRIINQFNRISRWVASAIVRVNDDAQMRLSMPQALHRAGALLPRRAEPARACTPSTSASTSWPCSGLKGLWEKLPTKWEKRYARARPALHPKSNSAAVALPLRCEHEVGVAGV